nr:MAG TPA: hypothetical protein [Caudoviricetes sp.]
MFVKMSMPVFYHQFATDFLPSIYFVAYSIFTKLN